MTDGWDAGFSDQDPPGGVTRPEPERPTLLIVDDADLKASLTGGLVNTFAKQPSGPPFRLLLLARHVGTWWQQLNVDTDYLAKALAADTLSLQAGQLSPDEQRNHHEAACAAFAAQLGHPASPIPAPLGEISPLPGDNFANPLLVHMNALLTVLGDTPAITADTTDTSPASNRREEILERILGRERRRWGPIHS